MHERRVDIGSGAFAWGRVHCYHATVVDLIVDRRYKKVTRGRTDTHMIRASCGRAEEKRSRK